MILLFKSILYYRVFCQIKILQFFGIFSPKTQKKNIQKLFSIVAHFHLKISFLYNQKKEEAGAKILTSLENRLLAEEVSSNRMRKLFIKLIFYYITFVSLIRKNFGKENESDPIVTSLNILYTVGMGFIIINHEIHPEYFQVYISVLIVISIYFYNWEFFGQTFGEHMLSYPNSILTLSYQRFAFNHKVIKRYVNTSTWSQVIFGGKSGLTPAGRATLIVAVVSGITFSFNAHMDRRQRSQSEAYTADQNRKAAEYTADQNRKAAEEMAKASKYETNQKMSHKIHKERVKEWENRPFSKINEPRPVYQPPTQK